MSTQILNLLRDEYHINTYSNLAQSVRSSSSIKPSQPLSTLILNLLREESHVENLLKSCSVCTLKDFKNAKIEIRNVYFLMYQFY